MDSWTHFTPGGWGEMGHPSLFFLNVSTIQKIDGSQRNSMEINENDKNHPKSSLSSSVHPPIHNVFTETVKT